MVSARHYLISVIKHGIAHSCQHDHSWGHSYMAPGDVGGCSAQLLFLGHEEEYDIDSLLSPFIMPKEALKRSLRSIFKHAFLKRKCHFYIIIYICFRLINIVEDLVTRLRTVWRKIEIIFPWYALFH